MLRLLNLFALLGAVAWFSRSLDWEPGITSLTLLATLFGQEVVRARNDHGRGRDRTLFLRFKEEFPSNGKAALFLRDHDIGASFSMDTLDELDRFLTQWNNAECQFLDRKLDEARKVLLIVGKEFSLKLSTSISLDSRGRYSIGLHDMEMRPEMLALQRDLNALATRVYRAHQNLIQAGARFE